MGVALGIVGLRIYGIAHALGDTSGSFRADFVADDLSSMLWEASSVLGIAAAVYLLAPPSELDSHSTADLGA
ncbi:MAG: hypothetical protein ACRDJ3_06765 [Solirubrobacteraceae bacterium]